MNGILFFVPVPVSLRGNLFGSREMLTFSLSNQKESIMLPLYSLVIDIVAENPAVNEEEFRELISPCLTYLDALKGAFDRKSCEAEFYPPDSQSEKTKAWSARCVVMISVGKQRAQYLVHLYEAVFRLIRFELPDCTVEAEISQFDFS